MDEFVIDGGRRLVGSVRVSAAKNAVLPILAASVLSEEPTTLEACPELADVRVLCEILTYTGCRCSRSADGAVTVEPSNASRPEIPREQACEIRSSIFLLGALLSRFGHARFGYPGGCDIGLRPIDLHLKGLSALGVTLGEEDGELTCDGAGMHAGTVHLDYPSVGATENIMMAAVRLDGVTTLTNAAKEPEIVDLAHALNAMGACVRGAGTDTVTVTGVKSLHGIRYRAIPDRIEAGTFLIAAAMTGGAVRVEGAKSEHLSALLHKLGECGCQCVTEADAVTLRAPDRLVACSPVRTLPYPGFATDLQAQLCSLLCIADGASVVTENLFESRWKHIPELVRMGADAATYGRAAVIRGVGKLHGATVRALDLRGGAALVLAGLAARGVTTVENAHIVDRGYEGFAAKLNGLGACVARK